MSRTTAGIMRINQELDKISGLDGIVADKIEELERQVKDMVSDILKNHPDATIFDYNGLSKKAMPKETFELELTNGYKTEFIQENEYEVNVDGSVIYVKDGKGKDVPFSQEDFKESFYMIHLL